MGVYDLTPTAHDHLGHLTDCDIHNWGRRRTYRYVRELYAGFQHIADRHDTLPKRTRVTGASKIQLRRVGSHYIACVILAPDLVAITSILHQRMDVSTRLRELQALTDREVGDMRAAFLRSMFKP